MRILRTFLLFGSVVLLTSCTRHLVPLFSFAHFSPPVQPTFAVDTNNAVVYGRFAMKSEFAWGNELALRLASEDFKRVYLIRFRDTNSVCAIAVEPGRYRVAGFIATFVDHRPAGWRNFRDSGTFEIRPNAVTYLGDFYGYAKVTPMVAQEWGMNGLTNNFAATTEECRSRFPNLASAQVFSAFDELVK